VSDLKRIIREAGREPVERDTLYRPIAAMTLSEEPQPVGAAT
jgi:2-iminoacetate synthase ThiH